MVQMKEFRIVMPLSMDELQVGQMYMIMRMAQQHTTGPEGVELLENKPFENEFGVGQYTLKNYRLQSKTPSWLAAFAPTDALVMQEEAWNAYPRSKSVVKCLYFTRFLLTIETIVKPDRGETENIHGLTEEQLALRQVEKLDISSDKTDYWSYVVGRSDIDFSQFKSAATSRGPLLKGWQQDCSPVVTAYKLVTVDAPYWGFGSRLEQALISGERALFLESFRNCVGWIDEWFGMSMERMREVERHTYSSLNQKLGRASQKETEEGEEEKTKHHV